MDFLLPLLGGALGAALINGFFAHFKIRRDALVEHDKWRRDQRQVEYSTLVQTLWEFSTSITRAHRGLAKGREALDAIDSKNRELYEIYARLSLVMPSQVIPSTARVFTAATALLAAYVELGESDPKVTKEDFDKAYDAFTACVSDFKIMARQDLGIAPETKEQMKAFVKLEQDLVDRHARR